MENEPRRRDQLTTPRVGFGDRDRVQFRSSILCNFRSSITAVMGSLVKRRHDRMLLLARQPPAATDVTVRNLGVYGAIAEDVAR